MTERHEKWVRVEPGTVIPAGQPYRYENGEGFAFENLGSGLRSGTDGEWFVDSSWKPPLVLPTEPTWGIAVVEEIEDSPIEWIVDRWTHESRKYDRSLRMSGYHTSGLYETSAVLDFIPLTDEQVARIEAAR